ncbi:DUF2975 domain-containing protein [Gaetbulibacter aquiaggeris]|uniref:DUF2975 domain-containing protein n=1 Tax=Gaetbulibacter aquiaggeris TaxID=1735373 RepID=A0ABW7MLQ3_9FLAO
MKTINILKKLITIYYYLMIIGFVGAIISLPLLLFTNQSYEITFLGSKVDLGVLPLHKSLITLILVGTLYYLFFRAVRLIKLSLKDLSEGNYFSILVILSFKKIGTLFLICGFGSAIVKLVLGFLLANILKVGVDTSWVIFIIMGLFFLFLSEVFSKAGELRRENDLTI